MTVRETPYHSYTPSDLTVKPFKRIVRADMPPVIRRKVVEGKRLFGSSFDDASGFVQTKRLELDCNLFCFLSGGLLVLLGMDSLQHGGNYLGFAGGYSIQDIPIEVDYATLPATFREKVTYGIENAGAFV